MPPLKFDGLVQTLSKKGDCVASYGALYITIIAQWQLMPFDNEFQLNMQEL